MSYTKTKIIARRIPSGLGNFPRSTTVEAHTVRGGLGTTYGCGADQTMRNDVTYAGIKGQCMTDAQYAECKSTGKVFGQPCGVDTGGDSGSGAEGAILGVLTSFFAPPKPTMPTGPAMAPRQQGMSQSTMIALGIGAVGLLAIVMLASK